MPLSFPYYYGHAGEQYAFFRIPKLLITDSRFDGVSSDAKLLYGLLLDRMELSYRNGWVDDQNRVFIIFTVEEVMETLRCRSEKAVRLFAELDSKKGIGLIERKRQGLGKPAIIYVKNFAGDISWINRKSRLSIFENHRCGRSLRFCDFRFSKVLIFGFRISWLSKIEI